MRDLEGPHKLGVLKQGAASSGTVATAHKPERKAKHKHKGHALALEQQLQKSAPVDQAASSAAKPDKAEHKLEPLMSAESANKQQTAPMPAKDAKLWYLVF